MKYDASTFTNDPKTLKENLLALTQVNAQLIDNNNKLSNDIDALKKDNDSLYKNIDAIIDEKQKLSDNVEYLKAQLEIFKRRFFGRKSEKLTHEDEGQLSLFNEAETEADEPESKSEPKELVTIEKYTRRKAGRKPISDKIPREEIIHDLKDDEKKCPCCDKVRPLIGRDETEELDIIPAKIRVLKHIYNKYGTCSCEEFLHSETPEVKSAPFEKRMIPGSIASPGLLAYTFVSKFDDALPFYRQSEMFERLDINIPRATFCNWQMLAAEKLTLFMDVLLEHLKKGFFVRMDETTVQVLHEPNRSPQNKSYMWIAIGYPARGRPLVYMKYSESRSSDIPDEILSGFKGYLQTDGYAGYNKVVRNNQLIHVGCNAHARRGFIDVYDANKKNKSIKAYTALELYQKIYKIESDLRFENIDDDVFVERRRNLVTPVLNEFHEWLLKADTELTSQSPTGKAVKYTINEWEKLIRYLDLACMTPDNNESEHIAKQFAIGRKNWLFSNTPRGAHSSAVMYSLIESAKANKLNPYDYLRFLFTKLPYANDKESIEKLLPCYLSKDDIKL